MFAGEYGSCIRAVVPRRACADTGSAVPEAQTDNQSKAADAGDVPDNPQPADHAENQVRTLPWQLMHDQIGMWTSPRRLKLSDATWLVPAGGFAAALFATDSDVSGHLSNNPSTLLRYRHISDYGMYSMVGSSAGISTCWASPHKMSTSVKRDFSAESPLSTASSLSKR